MYEYNAYPMMELSCDPYGSTLHLHCAVTGPISPQFHLQWYLSNPDTSSTATELDSEIVLNVVKDGINSISSILSIGPISSMHTGHCILCQIEFEEMGISLTRDDYKLCIGNGVSYTSLPPCAEEMVVFNSTSYCATAQDIDFLTLQQVDEGSAVPPTHLATPSPTEHSTLQDTLATTESEVGTPDDVTASSNVVTSSTSNMSNSTAPNSQSAVEGGLFVAIAICIVFILIIIILMYFVVRLFREWKWKREEKERESAEDQSEY